MKVGGGRGDALLDDSGEPQPDRTVGTDAVYEVGDSDGHRGWGGRARGGDVLSIADQRSSFEVDRRGLDSGASNVHSESNGHGRPRSVR